MNEASMAEAVLPKGTDLARWSAEEIEAVATTLNKPALRSARWWRCQHHMGASLS
jgi:IS30 family transposase